MTDPVSTELTPEQLLANPAVRALFEEGNKQAAEAAVRALNPVDPDTRPGGTAVVSNVNRRRYGLPRLGTAMQATYAGGFRKSQEFERDFSEAAKSVFKYSTADFVDEKDPFLDGAKTQASVRSLIWAKSRDEMVEVLDAMGEKAAAREADYAARIESGVRAMTEAAGGAALVPTQYMQDKFQYALVSMTAVRRSGVESMPVSGNVVSLPRESVPAGASVAAEAGTLTPQDPTLASQNITIKKQYGYRLYSNELLNDATPAWNEFLANTLVRDVALKQDQQFLEGTGSGNEITGLVNYSGVTSGPAMGTNGSTPTLDNLIDATYLLRGVNVEPDVAFGNPRTMQSFSKIKDSTGNYILWASGGYNAPSLFNGQTAGQLGPGIGRNAVLLNQIDFFFSNQMLTNRTVGSAGTATDLVITNRKQLLIIERQGLEVAYSEHVAFNTDQTAARCIGRAAIVALQPTAVLVWTGLLP